MGVLYVGTEPSKVGDIQTANIYQNAGQVDAVRTSEIGYFATSTPDTFFGPGVSVGYNGDTAVIKIETHTVVYATGSNGTADEVYQIATIAYGWAYGQYKRTAYPPAAWTAWEIVKPDPSTLKPEVIPAHNVGFGVPTSKSGDIYLVSGSTTVDFNLYTLNTSDIGVFHDFIVDGVIGTKTISPSFGGTIDGSPDPYVIPPEAKWVRVIMVAASTWVVVVVNSDSGSGPSSVPTFIQQTEPAVTGPAIWYQTDGSGNVIKKWIQTT